MAAGTNIFELTPGTYRLSGTLTSAGTAGALVSIAFVSVSGNAFAGNGVRSGSVRNVSGPGTAGPCSVQYDFDGPGQRAFELEFTVAPGSLLGCCPP